MPNRDEVMMAAREYIDSRESARASRPATSAIMVGTGLIAIGVMVFAISFKYPAASSVMIGLGCVFLGLGIALVLLGRAGVAKHRVTETTRYPQQTGQLSDLFFQVVGENFLWILVAMLMLVVFGLAFLMGGL
jgi:hypothetical protein